MSKVTATTAKKRGVWPLAYLGCVVIFALVQGGTFTKQSASPHFVLQAQAWLDGQLHIDREHVKGDDWVVLRSASLPSGRTVWGRTMTTKPGVFLAIGGQEIPRGEYQLRGETRYYNSFPPFPAVFLTPFVAIFGDGISDVAISILLAGLTPLLFFVLLGRLTQRETWEKIILSAVATFGSVFFFASIQGSVWFFAHVLGTNLALLYFIFSIRGQHPWLAGIFLGLAATTRTPMAFLFVFFAWESWKHRQHISLPKVWIQFALPVVVIAVAAMTYNYLRFESVFEFGHRFLHVRQQHSIETHGLFSASFLGRNLHVVFALLPHFGGESFVKISGHGMAIWITMPFLFWLAWPRIPVSERPRAFALLATVAVTLLPPLLYQNTGWYQFGYRFILDCWVPLFLLFALSVPRLSKPLLACFAVAIALNLFGALTFSKHMQFYDVSPEAFQKLN